MNKIAVVYWSGTGNTQAMAEAVISGAKEKGGEASLYQVGDFNPSMVSDFDAIAFGCPAMGAEGLEDTEFEPVFSQCDIKDKKIALFGSYGWGGGEWMNNWEERCRNDGADIICDSIICADSPDDDVIESCKAMGEKLLG